MKHNDAAAARERIGPEATLTIQLSALTNVVRAMMLTHPEPDRLQAVFDHLTAAMQAQAGYMAERDHQTVLRDFVETVLFPQPPTPP